MCEIVRLLLTRHGKTYFTGFAHPGMVWHGDCWCNSYFAMGDFVDGGVYGVKGGG